MLMPSSSTVAPGGVLVTDRLTVPTAVGVLPGVVPAVGSPGLLGPELLGLEEVSGVGVPAVVPGGSLVAVVGATTVFGFVIA